MYSFPNEEDCLLRFLDTRGLGEAGQDGSEEIPKLEAEADLIIVVVKAMDHAQQHVLDILRGVAARHPTGRSSCCKPRCTKATRPTGCGMRFLTPTPSRPIRPRRRTTWPARSWRSESLFRDYRGPFRAGRFHACRKTVSTRWIMAWSNSGR